GRPPPSLQYSITPSLHHSVTPSLRDSRPPVSKARPRLNFWDRLISRRDAGLPSEGTQTATGRAWRSAQGFLVLCLGVGWRGCTFLPGRIVAAQSEPSFLPLFSGH